MKIVNDRSRTTTTSNITRMSGLEAFTPLNQITKGRDDQKVRVKVHYIWKKFWVNNSSQVSSIEMVLVDQHGNEIRACIEKETVKYFEPSFKDDRFIILNDVGRVVHITADRVIRDKNVVRIKGWNFNCLLQVSIFVALFGIQTTMIIKDQTGACEIILFDTQLNKIVNKK
ncbi:uncharacterized protein [Rutidosis leptorrhynchoides]|uniref:uncharacterized protein isoform X2 n=1 Tax=Rutidosis leptorrhynchoides TaxID=125765 RepID=UPI003A99D948